MQSDAKPDSVALFRAEVTSADRSLDADLSIDPGFVNHRLVQTMLGDQAGVLDEAVARLPPMPDWMQRTRINQIYSRIAVDFCRVNGVRTLGEVLAEQGGRVFCSTQQIAPCPTLYDASRVRTSILPDGNSTIRVDLEFSTSHLTADTIKSKLYDGARLSLVAQLDRLEDGCLVFHPLIIGSPWVSVADPDKSNQLVWFGHQYYEVFLEDFEEFSRVRELPVPESPAPMAVVSEAAFKRALASLLGDVAPQDWGGETSDYFAAHLHLGGRPVSAAFLLKGPARFAPMDLNHLGKNNDQIYRLSQEPADVLFVQHSHDVLAPVRATLRAFAVQPSRPRRYCIIDGRESLRLLQAYGLYEDAVEWSKAR